MELPQESLAHHHRRTRGNWVSDRVALLNLPKQRLLPSLRRQPFPAIDPRLQRGLRNILRINCNLPLSWNEANTDASGTGSRRKEEGSVFPESTKTPPSRANIVSYECQLSGKLSH